VRVIKFFFNVSEKQIFQIGFVGGIFAALFILGAGGVTYRRLTTSVDDVYAAALVALRNSPRVEAAIGQSWRPTGFQGHKLEPMTEAFVGSERRERSSYLEAPARRVQMMFLVKGMPETGPGVERSGLVSLEAFKRGGEYQFSFLSLDLKARPEKGMAAEHLFLEGSKDVVLFKELSEILESTRVSGRPEAEMADE